MSNNQSFSRKYSSLLILMSLLVFATLLACQAVPTLSPPTEPPSIPTFIPTTPTSEPEPAATSTATTAPPVYVLNGQTVLPEALANLINQLNLPQPQSLANEVVFSFEFNKPDPIGNWVYALVAPFPTVTDVVSSNWLVTLWQGQPEGEINRLLVSEDDLPALTSVLGEPGETVLTLPKEDLLESAWTTQHTWVIIPFEEIQPRWKVLSIDEQSPIHKAFDSNQYALTVPISLIVADAELNELPPGLQDLRFSNLDSSKITTVMLTGVTALVRATAVGMDERGVLVPGEHLAQIMQEVDILHISNEVPFAEECPAHTAGNYLRFCSPADYMELLRYIGTDIVELTGDHFQDYGEESMLYTLDLYTQAAIPYYGGGKDIIDARKPVKLEVNGNKFAFIGCNAKDPSFARASESSTGAYHCEMDYMAHTVRSLRDEGYLPIATFQHEEVYTWSPVHAIERDFKLVADAGAIIASGSQAHVPHYAEFYEGSFLHYGLGNLFFDQKGIQPNTDISFLDRHVFYEGRYLGVELIPIWFIDKVQPRLMTPEEKADTLGVMFDTMRMWWKDEDNQPVRPDWK